MRTATAIPIQPLSKLSTAVVKAAYIQAMNHRGEHGNYPVSCPIDPPGYEATNTGSPRCFKTVSHCKKR